jgi:hypothetical protein
MQTHTWQIKVSALREELVPRLVRFGVQSRKISNVGQSLDMTKNLFSRAPLCFGRHVKQFVPAAFAVVSTHQSVLDPRGYGPFSLRVIHKEGLCPISRDINRLMMMASFKAIMNVKKLAVYRLLSEKTMFYVL